MSDEEGWHSKCVRERGGLISRLKAKVKNERTRNGNGSTL